ncbi:GatB/YqeY domain-containing protein [Propionicicella superfundia]|uniref:GatB/YqeY domain-containing protein n=1 Tax=Propionicicella superfundia TaxID=348582 RepID=UPI000427178F|nr:GatB/YqeY domain-containing protein [Propionicicella superfundia]
MGALKDRLRTDLVAAMRAKDEIAKTTLRSAIAAIQNAEVAGDTARDLSEDEELAVVNGQVTSRRDSAEAYTAGGRPELAERELAEVEILLDYLPAPLTDAEVEAIVSEEVARAAEESGAVPTMRDMGRIMKAVTARVSGRAPGAEVAAKVKRTLS